MAITTTSSTSSTNPQPLTLEFCGCGMLGAVYSLDCDSPSALKVIVKTASCDGQQLKGSSLVILGDQIIQNEPDDWHPMPWMMVSIPGGWEVRGADGGTIPLEEIRNYAMRAKMAGKVQMALGESNASSHGAVVREVVERATSMVDAVHAMRDVPRVNPGVNDIRDIGKEKALHRAPSDVRKPR